ncbi:TadE/TadG family type IV pilus assembly protein [Salipiger sp.]|uniref:TadE/TadG family type IV pilus assembly protein n=1 Tax=Salipiger sp. TaxID=2078585 RepID=UPI003A96AEBC
MNNRFFRAPSPRRFWRDETGSFTVEVVVWSPLLLVSLLLILDFANLMVVNASMWNAARDTARAVSIHHVTPDDSRDYLRDNLFFRHEGYVIDVDVDAATVQARVQLDAAHAALTPAIGRYLVGTMVAKVTMLREPQ